MKLILFLSYHGGNYHGFQKQPKAPSIQTELEKTLARLFPKLCDSNNAILTQGAGRTDAGVHGSEQVLAVSMNPPTRRQIHKITLSKLPQVINNLLPADIRILSAHWGEEDFHPRYRARVRCYRYRILTVDGGMPYALEDSLYHSVPFSLELLRLERYFCFLEGQHDFTSFTSLDSKSSIQQPMRTIYKIDLIKKGREVIIDIYGGSFLKSMVRSLIGNVLYHYRRGSSPETIRDILKARDPSLAKHRVPAHALFLRRVFFTPLFGDQTR